MHNLLLLAEGTGLESVAPLLSTVGSIGFAVWYGWYTSTVTIPKKDEAHREERQGLATSHASERKEMQERHDGQLKQLIDELHRAQDRLATGRTWTAGQETH